VYVELPLYVVAERLTGAEEEVVNADKQQGGV
jgi:hypothetical protein